jgi:hypothetical protein
LETLRTDTWERGKIWKFVVEPVHFVGSCRLSTENVDLNFQTNTSSTSSTEIEPTKRTNTQLRVHSECLDQTFCY